MGTSLKFPSRASNGIGEFSWMNANGHRWLVLKECKGIYPRSRDRGVSRAMAEAVRVVLGIP